MVTGPPIAPGIMDRRVLVFAGLGGLGGLALPAAAHAASAKKLSAKCRSALSNLYATSDKAKALGARARSVLIFPEILKAGLVVGGQTGDGAMLKGGKVVAFYNTSAASYGLQIGAQKYGYALFFMTDKALEYLNKSDGWSVGSGLSVVFIDDGFAKPMSTTTLTQDVYAIAFGQKGLMAGSGIEGAKIRQIHPDP